MNKVDIVLKYNPFLLKLIYSRCDYLDYLLTIYLSWSSSLSKGNKREHDVTLMRFLIEDEYYSKMILEDIRLLDYYLNQKDDGHKYKFDIFHVNFEFSVFRLWVLLVTGIEENDRIAKIKSTTFFSSLMKEFDDYQFDAEMIICQYVKDNNERVLLLSLVERYIEDFYFNPNGYEKKRVTERVQIFLDTKLTIEKEVHKVAKQEDICLLFAHTKESIMSSMLLYLVGEFIYYLRVDEREWIVDKFGSSKKTSVDSYHPTTGISMNSEEPSCERENFRKSLEVLQKRIFDQCIKQLKKDEELSLRVDNTFTVSSFMSKFNNSSSSLSTNNDIIYNNLRIREEEDDEYFLNSISEYDNESFYFTFRMKEDKPFVKGVGNGGGAAVTASVPLITKTNMNTFNHFIKEGGRLQDDYIYYITIQDEKHRLYYESIIRVFLFDITLRKSHYCEEPKGRKNTFDINQRGRKKRMMKEGTEDLSRPTFLCSICRYNHEHGEIFRDFYHYMQSGSYLKKYHLDEALLRKNLSFALETIDFDIIEPREGCIYKIFYLTYLILYHTTIISDEILNNFALPPSLSQTKVLFPAYENIFTFLSLHTSIKEMKRSVDCNDNVFSNIEYILNLCRSISPTLEETMLMITYPLSKEKLDNSGSQPPFTPQMIRLGVETELFYAFMVSVSNQQVKCERFERMRNLYSTTKIDTHNSIIKALNTIYCYYIYILTRIMKNEVL